MDLKFSIASKTLQVFCCCDLMNRVFRRLESVQSFDRSVGRSVIFVAEKLESTQSHTEMEKIRNT